ncbi:MAG TPA: hypothetical protein VGO11_23885 [Chthoniobacteraceae bacterium]|jgi:Ni/Co efflux regulator RcnB|nr:hypothetical protein [Chthoniobacteraceae bacterium]
MKHTIVAFLSALLFLAFTPSHALADDHHRNHRKHWDHDRDYHRYDHDRGHHYGYERHHRSEYRAGHYAWVNHHRVWVPARTVVIYF